MVELNVTGVANQEIDYKLILYKIIFWSKVLKDKLISSLSQSSIPFTETQLQILTVLFYLGLAYFVIKVIKSLHWLIKVGILVLVLWLILGFFV